VKQAFHIFKKDVRGLAYEIAVNLLLTAGFVFVDSRPQFTNQMISETRANLWSGIPRIFLALSWWLLTARAVHA
jgi:hypothetical protein